MEILKKIEDWIKDLDTPQSVLCVKGQAGRGKSALASSVYHLFRRSSQDAKGTTAASAALFYFRRDEDPVNKRVIRAIARQLGGHGDGLLKRAILEAIEKEKDVSPYLDQQFSKFIVDPLKDLGSDLPPTLVVVDALDESPHSRVLINLISRHHSRLPKSLKLLLTSRPESDVLSPLRQLDLLSVLNLENLDELPRDQVDRDIGIYVQTRLTTIKNTYEFPLSEGWPKETDVDQLVCLADGLFQWAHTVMELLARSKDDPETHLTHLLRNPDAVRGLDSLYSFILSSAFPASEVPWNSEKLSLIRHFLACVLTSEQPVSLSVIAYLWADDAAEYRRIVRLLERGILNHLRSMAHIPVSPNDPVHFIHTSVRDFLTDESRCADPRFCTNLTSGRDRILGLCFRRMRRDLRKDICNLEDPFSKIDEIRPIVADRVPLGLQFACRSWPTYLNALQPEHLSATNMTAYEEFSGTQLLFWLEVMSLSERMSEVVDLLGRAIEWLKVGLASQSLDHSMALNDSKYLFRLRARVYPSG